MQSPGSLVKPSMRTILSPPSRVPVLSVYITKLVALAFVWLCSIVVWGHEANVAGVQAQCQARCIVQIVFSAASWLFASILLFLNYKAESNRDGQEGYTGSLEPQLITFLVIIWTIVITSASTRNGADFVTIWFSWLGFFGSIYATFKSYHSLKEADLPSNLPDNFDEENYVYG